MTHELTPSQKHSKWIFGSSHALGIWHAVAQRNYQETFLQRDIVLETKLNQTIVRPMLNRLAAIALIGETGERPHLRAPQEWIRLESDLWVPLISVMEEALQLDQPKSQTP